MRKAKQYMIDSVLGELMLMPGYYFLNISEIFIESEALLKT